MKPPEDHRFWSMLSLARVPFWVHIFHPAIFLKESPSGFLIHDGVAVDEERHWQLVDLISWTLQGRAGGEAF